MEKDEKNPAPYEKKFGCPACRAKMTYGLKHCDGCGEEAPIYNRRAFWPLFYVSIAAMVLGHVALLIVG